MRILLTALLLLSTAAFAAAQSVAIKNCTIIHTHTDAISTDATVLITDARITAVGGADTEIPAGARVIDGTGKYLIPGLVDGHIHFFQSGGLYTRPDAIDLRKHEPYDEELAWIRDNIDDVFRRYLRCGITTVVDCGGPMWNFDVREEARTSACAPRVFLTGPLIASYQPDALTTDDPPIIRVESPEEARELVRKQAALTPDFIKVWYVVSKRLSLSREAFLPTMEAVVDESRKFDLPVWVHATDLETARAAAEAGADVLVHDVTDKTMDEDFLALLRENDITLIPTLWVFQSYALVFAGQFSPTLEELRYANPYVLGSLFDIHGYDEAELPERVRALQQREGLDKPNTVHLTNVKKLHEAGVRVAAGTDAGNIGALHGPSLEREMQLMHEAGLDNHDVLMTATLNGAALVGRGSDLGSIEEGKLADLVLLNGNPLEDLKNTLDIDLVIKDGAVFDPDTLLSRTPEDLAQMQLNAYNAGNLDAFVEVYHPDVEAYAFPGTPRFSGHTKMREIYGNLFQRAPDLHCKLVNRITYGNTVIDREIVTGVPGRDILEAVAMYEITDGLIRKVWFIQ